MMSRSDGEKNWKGCVCPGVTASTLVTVEAASRPRRPPRIGTQSGKVLSFLLNLVLVKCNCGPCRCALGEEEVGGAALHLE